MIPKECKRLAEVDFPIAAVSKHSAREKSIRHGHPSTLHLWWARRPLAACRAMLMALLLPDPCDEHCPAEFKRDARKALSGFSGGPTRWKEQMQPGGARSPSPSGRGARGEGASEDGDEVHPDLGLRQILLEFIADFANWDNAAKPAYLNTARALIKAAHPDETPLVVDPFAGGGSIPLEALRIGCDAFASDLNPVACLIQKVLLEDIPRHGPGLAEELRRIGAEIKASAEKDLAEFYPPDPDGAKPIAYLWARTVRCEAPNCGAEIPLVRSFWLCKKPKRKRALRYEVHRRGAEDAEVEFEIFEPTSEKDVPNGTVSRAKATCSCCGVVLSPDRVRAQLSEQRGGADVIFDEKGRRIGGARLLAVVTVRRGQTGRLYRPPVDRDYRAVFAAQKSLEEKLATWSKASNGLCPVPTERIPLTEIRRISVPLYGCDTWDKLFTARQKMALVSLSELARNAGLESNGQRDALVRLLAMSVSKQAERLSSLVSWITQTNAPRGAFARQALGFVWDFCELVPIIDQQEYPQLIDAMSLVIEEASCIQCHGQVQLADACEPVLPEASAQVWFTDPPYYDSVPYAHLADYFFVWQKRIRVDSEVMSVDGLTPKTNECVVDRPHRLGDSKKDNRYFEATMGRAMRACRSVIAPDGVGCVVFAHKTTEGWESLIGGMLAGGLTVTASWPIQTERSGRLNAQDTAALATSVHLVCRPRPRDASVGDWGEVLRELPRRVADWMERLEDEGVRGADLVFACIGPALEIFSRYSKVETAEGKTVPLADYLEKVWEVVGRTALNQVLGTAEGRARNGAAGALEEDARLTALFLWTMQATEIEARNGNGANGEEDDDDGDADDDEESGGGRASKGKGFSLIFDVARRFAQPLGIHLEAWENRIIKTEKGVVRLIPVLDRGRQLFGEEGAGAIADRLERSPATAAAAQMVLFPEPAAAPKVKGRGRGRRAKADASDADFETRREATTLDRVHAAMLLQASGRANALRALLKAEIDRGPDFLRLANALSALYPQGSDEKRLLDAMLLAVPR